jgi:hypothetical protein
VGFFDGGAVTGLTGLDGVGLDADGATGVVALCPSEGLLPSDALADPHAAVVRSAATAPAPRAYLLQLPAHLRFTFTEDPLFS